MKYLFTLLILFACRPAFSQWSANTSVNLEIAALNTADLQVAATADGKTWIAYYHNTGSNYDMRAQLLDGNGSKLLGPDGVLVSNQPSGSATFVFSICPDAANNLIIGFQYQAGGVNTAAVTRVNTDGSLPWGTTGITLTAGLSPYPAVLTTGETVVAWNNNNPATLYLQKLGTDGAAMWSSPVVVRAGTTNTTRGQILPAPGGAFTLIFQRKGVGVSTTLFAQRYDGAGNALWAAPVQLSNLTTSGARYYSVQAEDDTAYVGYYASSGSRFKSYVQRINPDGTLPWAINGAVFSDYATGSDPYQQTTNMAKAPGSPYVWAVCTYSNISQSQYGIYVQKFDRTTGARLLAANGKELFPITADLLTQTGTVNLANDAPLFMYYDKDYKIYATRLDANGDFVWPGTSVELSSTTATLAVPKGRFAFRPMVNNKAVAVWYENRGTDYRAYAQDVNSTGAVGVLPVKLGRFTAQRNGMSVELNWTTLTETANTGFYAERSATGTGFAPLRFVPSKATGGNSAGELAYGLTDVQPVEGMNYYRLKQVDADGKAVYSPVAAVLFSRGRTVLPVYPNPVAGLLQIPVERGSANGRLTIYNSAGQVVSSRQLNGEAVVPVETRGLAAGGYFITITGATFINTATFIKK